MYPNQLAGGRKGEIIGEAMGPRQVRDEGGPDDLSAKAASNELSACKLDEAGHILDSYTVAS